MAKIDSQDTGSEPQAQLYWVWAMGAAFCTYFCMYAFRKPFTAGEYAGTSLGGIEYKTVLVVSQVLGYTLSKFIGIKVVSEISAERRAIAIAGLIGVAELALVVFALVPAPWNFAALFVNGLPLGMVFGLVLAYLEGRRLTEALSAGLCASFIMSSGVVKSVGRALVLNYGVSEYWMPALTGLIFAPPLAVSIWMLTRIPPPDKADVEHRTERKPLTRMDRWAFFRKYSTGLSLLLGIYIVLTVLRSVRDDFAVEIWNSLGVSEKPEVFAQTETLVMFAVTGLNAAAILIARNRTAFLAALGLIGSGFCLVGLSSALQSAGVIGPFAFMVLSGIGLYVPYVAFHTTVFERLIAATRDKANLGFLMYLADSTGYLSYVGVMIASARGFQHADMLGFFHVLAWIVAAVSIVAVLCAAVWFMRRIPQRDGRVVVTAAEGGVS
ncbi:MAG: DUF5690 family protein [Planctomycetota bacterium]